MRTDIDHLSARKRRELERVVKLIFEAFDDACALSNYGGDNPARILKIILCGSHARGIWVDEQDTAEGYGPNFDLLIIVNDKRLTDRVKYWERLEDRLMGEFRVAKTLRTPVNFIVHTLQEANEGLAHGHSIFMAAKQEGVALYQSDDTELHSPGPMTPNQSLAMAEECFDDWFLTARRKLVLAQDAISQNFNKEAAFLLHQTCECLYRCVLLVWTFDTPPVHDLGLLRRHAERSDPRLACVWPHDLMKDRARFEKLEDAYVKAHNSEHYHIITEELDWLFVRVKELGRVVHDVCSERIDRLRVTSRAACDKA
ncbi:nucleotidyltransferase [Porphyrobacter sp. YT40]|uniref:nucleotidyltransferase n=1 Tax=Porphyrobacter sp. YT40 TaxID=2547601 RepID=UPI001141D2D9|nr:nucleotidyltransferase [Porphyrobacter sp. YT40]QDH33913.1 nucleotidyltransferase [Porphyrobacter sp. YT40]